MNSEQNKKILCILLVVVVGLSFGYKFFKAKKNFDKINEQKEEFHNELYDNDLSGIDLIVVGSEKITENLPTYIKEDEIYIKVYLKIKNNSNEPFEFSWQQCYADDENGEEIRANAMVDLNGLHPVTINTGESIEGYVSFLINKDNSIHRFKYYKGIMSKVPAFEYDINY